MFSDLECDYINPIDLCNKLNQASSWKDFTIKLPTNIGSTSLVRSARKYRTCLPHPTFPTVWPMGGLYPQPASCVVQREQVRNPLYHAYPLFTYFC